MFIAHVKQHGGCDYTIACGETVWWLKADTHEAAIEELKDIIIGKMELPDCSYFEGFWGEQALSNVTLFEISGEEIIPIAKWYKEALKCAEEAKAKLGEKDERAELERLKKKYEKDDFERILRATWGH
jgi:hypothetical protein